MIEFEWKSKSAVRDERDAARAELAEYKEQAKAFMDNLNAEVVELRNAALAWVSLTKAYQDWHYFGEGDDRLNEIVTEAMNRMGVEVEDQ